MKKSYLWLLFPIALMTVNIILACIYTNDGANIFTTISGWVSGIATFAIGIIAYLQSRQYAFMSKRNELIDKIVIERRDFISELSQIIRYNNIVNIINELSNSLELNKDLSQQYKYYFQLLELKDSLFGCIDALLTYSFIYGQLEELVKSLFDMISFVNNNFGFRQQYSNRLSFSVDMATSLQASLDKIQSIRKLKHSCLNEMQSRINKIYEIKSISELQNFQDDLTISASLVREHIISEIKEFEVNC